MSKVLIIIIIIIFIIVAIAILITFLTKKITVGSYYKKPKKARYTLYNGDLEASTKSSVASNDKTPLIHSDENSKGAASPMGGPNGAASTENMNGDAKPTNSKLSFWNNRSISLMDMYGADGNDEKCGEINFGLDYDFATQTLKLKIIQGKDLAAKDTNGLSDPYVRITLLPDKKQRLDTKIKRRTLNPRWNETIYFEGFPINKLQSRVLHLHVYDYDRFSRDDSIGEFHLPLCQVDFTSKPTYWKALYPPIKAKLGELLVSLTYHPAKNTLTIFVMKAKNLKAKDINGKSDPYVKVWLMFGDKRVEKKKTPVYKCNLNPIFNATFEFDVPWEQIRDCALDVTVMDFDTVGRNELIGKLILGSKNGSGATETKQWQDMIAKPRQSVVVWHRLKPGE